MLDLLLEVVSHVALEAVLALLNPRLVIVLLELPLNLQLS